MQNYTTIIGVLEMRESNFSYRDCRARYNIGQGTVKLIITTVGVSNCIYAEVFEDEKIDSFIVSESGSNQSCRSGNHRDHQCRSP